MTDFLILGVEPKTPRLFSQYNSLISRCCIHPSDIKEIYVRKFQGFSEVCFEQFFDESVNAKTVFLSLKECHANLFFFFFRQPLDPSIPTNSKIYGKTDGSNTFPKLTYSVKNICGSISLECIWQ